MSEKCLIFGFCIHSNEHLCSVKGSILSSLAGHLLASQEALCSMKVVFGLCSCQFKHSTPISLWLQWQDASNIETSFGIRV
jgi:hypothetical protein